ncbi:MAG: hypothetical protein U0821_05250 [Chloroflexota bacterium]
MREELAKLVQERVGLDEATALQVADVALELIKSRLPESIQPLLEGGEGGALGGLGGMLGGLLGGGR